MRLACVRVALVHDVGLFSLQTVDSTLVRVQIDVSSLRAEALFSYLHLLLPPSDRCLILLAPCLEVVRRHLGTVASPSPQTAADADAHLDLYCI